MLDDSEDVNRAKWARMPYYVHLAEHKAQQEHQGKVVMDAFAAIQFLEMWPEDKRDALIDLLRQVSDARTGSLIAYLTAEWAPVWEQMPSIAQVCEAAMQRNW